MARAGQPVPATLEAILPPGAVGVERGAIGEHRAQDPIPDLYTVEAELIAGASPRRRREFAEARACARQALEALGIPPGPIPAAADGAPIWPAGVVGSITHKGGYRAAVVAFAADVQGIGIDAELDEPLPDGVLATIASREDLDQVEALLEERPETAWDRLLFCAKEAAVKAGYSLGVGGAGVREVEVSIDPLGAAFQATYPRGNGTRIRGAWAEDEGLVLAVARSAQAAKAHLFDRGAGI